MCSRCGVEKPEDRFRRSGSGPIGRRSECNDCRAERVKAQRRASPERSILGTMIQRCHNPKHPKFHHYGGRGIAVCEEWRGDGGADRFLAHIGPRPSSKHEVDRIHNDRGYEPGNVRWATRKEQMQNTRRNRLVTLDGRTQSMTAWENELGVSTFAYRIARGETPERARRPTRGRFRFITHNGRTQNLVEWSRHLGGEASLVATRLHHGWTEEEAVSVPAGQKRGWRKAS